MINGVKARINAVPEFEDNVFVSFQDLDAVKDIKQEHLPTVELWYGETNYGASEQQTITRQTADIRILALLFCETADLLDLEKKLIQALQGFVNAPALDNPMEGIKSRNWKVSGAYTARLIELSMESQYQQQNYP